MKTFECTNMLSIWRMSILFVPYNIYTEVHTFGKKKTLKRQHFLNQATSIYYHIKVLRQYYYKVIQISRVIFMKIRKLRVFNNQFFNITLMYWIVFAVLWEKNNIVLPFSIISCESFTPAILFFLCQALLLLNREFNNPCIFTVSPQFQQ